VLTPLVEKGETAALAVAEDGPWDPAHPVTRARASGDGHLLDGVKHHVLDGHAADVLVVTALLAGEPALFAVRAGAEGVAVERCATLDPTRAQAVLRLDAAPATLLSPAGDGGAAVAHAVHLLQVALAVEAAGAAGRCLAMTVEHLKTRVQFGRRLGEFQALRHRCADLAVLVEAARSTACYAARAVSGAPGELPLVAPLAKLYCADAFMRVAAEAIQLHGGIGITWEHDAHLYLKRAKSTQLLSGTPSDLRRLVAERAGLAP
jgi:alkylation response protein AidB-like acyl-CoA dehydrogenase